MRSPASTASPTRRILADRLRPRGAHVLRRAERHCRAALARLNYDPRSRRFDAAFELPGTAARRAPLRLTGVLTETFEAAVPVRALAQGEIVQAVRPHDRAPAEERARRRRPDHGGSRRSALPPSARCAAGKVIRQADLMKPELVARNETVTIVFEVPGIMLDHPRQGAGSGRAGRPDQRAQRAIQAHRPGDRDRPRPGHRRAPRRRASRPTPIPPTRRASAPSERHESQDQVFELHVSARGVAVSSEMVGLRCAGDDRVGASPLPARGQRRRLRRRRRVKAMVQIAALWALGSAVAGCSALERLKFIGDAASADCDQNPTTQPGYKPVQMPMPAPQPASYQPNSLWRTGSRAFFKDQRAHQVGDILTVKVKITDKATLENETQRSRKNNEDSGVDNFFGKPKVPITRIHAGADRASSPPTSTLPERRQGLGRPQGRAAHQRRRRGHAGAAERQPGDRGQAGGAGQFRSPRADRRRHRAAGGHRERQHHRLHQDRARPASPMAAAARSPTCSSRATASRCSDVILPF